MGMAFHTVRESEMVQAATVQAFALTSMCLLRFVLC
jgi:hypothetical protein